MRSKHGAWNDATGRGPGFAAAWAPRFTSLALAFTALLIIGLATAQEGSESDAPDERTQLIGTLRAGLADARDNDARRNLPVTYNTVKERVDRAEKDEAGVAELEALVEQVQRLQNQALFLVDLKKHRSPIEALLIRYDRSLRELAALEDVALDPTLSGDPAAKELSRQIERERLTRTVMMDSLRLANRYLNHTVGDRSAQQESTITALRVEVSALRQQLWDTELRAGVAEADRSAFQHQADADREREEAIDAIERAFGPDVGDIVLRPDGTLVIRVHGFNFGVGSASLPSSQYHLVDELAAAVGRMPGAAVRIEGHTDDTGSRDANLRLSRRRAETVARLLGERMGVDPASLETVGIGPDRPVASNTTAEGRARNRRIDVVIGPAP